MSKTTVLVETDTRELLRRIGRKEQTYDQLIRELIDERMKSKYSQRRTSEDLSGYGNETPTTRQISIDKPTGASATP
jgi:hypothetical protein